MPAKKVVVKNPNEKIIIRAAGARGPIGGQSYLKGNGLPSNFIGIDGDNYLDLETSLLYTKSGGNWGNPVQSVARAAISYVHTQNQPSDIWTINHNLSFAPAVSVMNFAGDNIECDIEYISDNELKLYFIQDSGPTQVSGYAYLS